MPRIRLPIRLTAPFTNEDDRALLDRFVDERDETAFAALVGRHARMVYGVCKRAVRDEHLAEDAFQAVFLVLARNPAGMAASASVGGWLFGIARRVGLAARRHEERQLRRRATVRSPVNGESNFDDLLQVLDEELARLPEDYRAPLIACFLEERTQDEAAKHLGWSLSTLRRRLDHGKELLRGRLTRRGATLAGGLFAGVFAPSVRATVPSHLLGMTVEPSTLAKTFAAEVTCGVAGMKLAFATMALAAITGLVLAFAGGDKSAPPDGPTTQVHRDISPAPRAVERTPWVTISGRVVFPQERDIPPLQLVPRGAVKDADFFGQPIVGDVLIDPRTRGIANAMVWLRPDCDDRKPAFPTDRVHPKLAVVKPQDHHVFASPGGFTPRVVAARAGDRVIYGNETPIAFSVKSDRVDVNANPVGKSGDFNVLLPRGQSYTTEPLPPLRICDVVRDSIHPWVNGYVWAFDHPYFAVTDANGNFTIPNAPAGTWRLMIWHEKSGYRNGAAGKFGERITISGDGTMNLGSVVHASGGWND
ncbi:MAG: sigma-70 family RNA polymerase sigma factor [Planctomycetes bacterium]|nr:sigma-70 family RNA polymerase sigma factor [Planctomycetota bacterium]